MEIVEEATATEQPEVKLKPRFHIWNHILEDDELSEKLAGAMNKLGDEFTRRMRRKRGNKKNKKKKKNKNSVTPNNGTNGVNGTSQPELKSQSGGESSKGQPPKLTFNLSKNQNTNQLKDGILKKSKDNKLPNYILQDEVKSIGKKLKEKRIDLIFRTIRYLGLEEAKKLCSEVLTIENAGGLMTNNGVRRRTPGGIFFHLIRSSGRYEAPIISKIFKEGEKEPVFKSRNKLRNVKLAPPSPSASSSSATVTNIANGNNELKPCDTSSAPNVAILPTEFIKLSSPIEPVNPQQPTQSVHNNNNNQLTVQPIVDMIKEPNEEINNPENSGLPINIKMADDNDDDDDLDSNLVIDEFDTSNKCENNGDENFGQLTSSTMLPDGSDLLIEQTPSPSPSPPPPPPPPPSTVNITESPSTINSNVTMFSSNRISVDA